MPTRAFIKSLASTSLNRRPTRRCAPAARLYVERLEDRRVPGFGPLVDHYPVAYSTGVTAADFNGDGHADLAVVANNGNGIGVRLGNGDGSFQAVLPSGAGGDPLVAADLNGDARADLVANAGVDVRVLLGNGDGTFQSPRAVVLPSQLPAGAAAYRPFQTPTSAAVADLDGDGRPDLVAGGYDVEYLPDGSQREDDYVNVAPGTAAGSFGPITTYRVASALNTLPTTGVLGVRDFDGDGKFDVLMNDHGRLSLFRGNGDGTLQGSPRVSDVGFSGGGLSRVADFDRDGVPDVLSGFSPVSVLRGNGDGTFSPAALAILGAEGVDVAAADVNADGNPDAVGIMAVDNNGGFYSDSYTTFSTRVVLGDGRGSFGSPIVGSESDTEIGDGYVRSLALADFDGDGLPDLAWSEGLIQGNGYGVLAVEQNDGVWASPPPTLPSIAIGDVAIAEGNTGSRAATFTVTLSAASSQPVTVVYATTDGTAAAGSDYQATSGTLTIPAGRTTGTITVLVTGDRLPEANETFFVDLSRSTNASIADGRGAGTIVDDEPRISITDVSRKEGKKGQATSFTFTVTLSAAYDQAVTMSFKTTDGTAKTSGQDYVAKAGTITFAPGETTKTITISVTGDAKNEANEAFYLDLSGLSSNALFTKSRGTGTILTDD